MGKRLGLFICTVLYVEYGALAWRAGCRPRSLHRLGLLPAAIAFISDGVLRDGASVGGVVCAIRLRERGLAKAPRSAAYTLSLRTGLLLSLRTIFEMEASG